MSMQLSSGSLLRSLARSSAPSISQQRHASTSKVTLGLSKSSSRSKPSPSRQTQAQHDSSDIPSNPKQRKIALAQPGRGVSNDDINEAKRDMQLRKMPYDETDLQWLREARSKIFVLAKKQADLKKEQKELTAEINTFMGGDGNPFKRGKRKAKASEKEAEVNASSKFEASDADAPAVESTKGEKEDEDNEQRFKKLRERAKEIRQALNDVDKEQIGVRSRSHMIRLAWPNRCHPDVPVGPEENAVLVSVKDPLNILPTEFDVMKETWNRSAIQIKDFPDGPQADSKRDHLALAASATNAEVDRVSGEMVTGSSWPYLLGSISMLEHALSQYAMSIVVRKGFLPVSPPDVVRTSLAFRCGFRPRDEKAKQTYHLENTQSQPKDPKDSALAWHEQQYDFNDLCLAATAEIPLAGLLASRTFEITKSGKQRKVAPGDDLIQRQELPIKLVALGHAFRAEAGARGADTRGLYRVHQFSKVEMFVATDGEVEKSDAMLEELRGVQEEVIGGLGLPYRVLDMPTQELGASAYRKYDIEVWMPGRGSWGEVSSASNCTDYQARRLVIKLKGGTSDKDDHPTVHTLNATAAAVPRLIVAILENHGVENGKLVLPDTLKPYWLAGEADPNVTWLQTGVSSGSQSRLQRALTQVRSIARKNGTDAPTMVASFLILHELTALIPLGVLFYVFGLLGVGTTICQWLLTDAEDADQKSLSSRMRAWARLKEARFERYCRKKGYLGFEKQSAEHIDRVGDLGKESHLAGSFANMVAAYILVKALLPFRIGASVALAGPFSRAILEPMKRVVLRRKPRVAV